MGKLTTALPTEAFNGDEAARAELIRAHMDRGYSRAAISGMAWRWWVSELGLSSSLDHLYRTGVERLAASKQHVDRRMRQLQVWTRWFLDPKRRPIDPGHWAAWAQSLGSVEGWHAWIREETRGDEDWELTVWWSWGDGPFDELDASQWSYWAELAMVSAGERYVSGVQPFVDIVSLEQIAEVIPGFDLMPGGGDDEA